MDGRDVARLLTVLEAEYPNSFSRMNDEQRSLKQELWAKEFKNDDSVLVYAAVKALMWSGREFAPNSGQIRDKMCEMMESNVLDEQQAWALVSKACSNGSYGYKKEFEKLPPEVQRAVGRPEQLRDWAAMDVDTVQSVVASNFMRSYRSGMVREKEMARIPQDVKNLIGNISEKMKLEGKNEGHYLEG